MDPRCPSGRFRQQVRADLPGPAGQWLRVAARAGIALLRCADELAQRGELAPQRNGFLIDRGQRAHNGVVDRGNDVVKFQVTSTSFDPSESLRCERMD